MAKVYNEIKKQLEDEGFLPFVGIAEWPPGSESRVIERHALIFNTKEGAGVKGVHTWNLIGRNKMVVIGWTNSPVSLQKFCTSVTYNSDIRLEVSPAIDHDKLMEAITAINQRMGDAVI